MKKLSKILTVVITMLVGISSVAFARTDDNGSVSVKKKDIIIVSIPNSRHFERSMKPTLDAYYYPSLNEVEIEAFGQGNVLVCVFDMQGQMCGYAEYNSDERPVERVELTAVSGLYRIIIYTDKSYSEGLFLR